MLKNFHRTTDAFKNDLDTWVGITNDVLEEIYLDSSYALRFRKSKSSKVEYIGSEWRPDLSYYIEKQLVTKIDYLESLRRHIGEFREMTDEEKEFEESLIGRGVSDSNSNMNQPYRIISKKKSKNKNPKWWVKTILAPIIVLVVGGLILWLIQKSQDPRYGELLIECNVDSAKIYLNTDYMGLSSGSEVVKFESLKPGTYVLYVKKEGYLESIDEKLKITVGEITAKKIQLKPDKKPYPPDDSATYEPPPPSQMVRVFLQVDGRFENATKIFIDKKPAEFIEDSQGIMKEVLVMPNRQYIFEVISGKDTCKSTQYINSVNETVHLNCPN